MNKLVLEYLFRKDDIDKEFTEKKLDVLVRENTALVDSIIFIDLDEHPEYINLHSIQSTPVINFWKDGVMVLGCTGCPSMSYLINEVSERFYG